MPSLSPPVTHVCGLCSGQRASLFYQHKVRPIVGRQYYQCADCGLIQVAAADRLTLEQEKDIYDQHNNDPNDPHYHKFLSQLTAPLIRLLNKGYTASQGDSLMGLDFGCGPGPALSAMLREQGLACCDYDIFYAPQAERLQRVYDFVTATEVFEHLARPAEVLDQLISRIKPGGFLALMMQRPDEQDSFAHWGYLRDPTHISFYTNQALAFIADQWSLTESHRDRNVIIWQINSNSRV